MTQPTILAAPRARASATSLVATLDIGGTKIAGALVDADGRLPVRSLRRTPDGSDGAAVTAVVQEVLDELRARPEWHRVIAAGVSSTGPLDTPTGTVTPVNLPGWRDFPLARMVAKTTGLSSVVLVNDAVAAAAAEHWRGAARGHDNALCMVVSTGVGGGLVLAGRVREGPTGNAGHIGHISVDLDGDACRCGTPGCVERFASGPNIVRQALSAGWRPAERTRPTAVAVAAAARAGDPAALDAFDRAARALAAGIAATATLLEIRLAVIGGGVSAAGAVLFDPLRTHLRAFTTLHFTTGVEVVPAAFRADAGLIGAAVFAFAAVA
jgi:glucokinase